MKRQLSERVKDRALALAVGVVAALVAVCLVATLWTVSERNGEIQAIRAQNQTDTQILKTVNAEIKSLKAGDAAVSKIFVEAGQAVQMLESQEAAIERALGIAP